MGNPPLPTCAKSYFIRLYASALLRNQNLASNLVFECEIKKVSHCKLREANLKSLALQETWLKSRLASCLAIPNAISDPVNPGSHSLHKLARSSQD